MQNNHENVLDSNNNKRPLNKTRTFAYLSLEVINGRLISNELWTVRRLISTQYLFNKTVQKGNEKNHVCHVRVIKKIPYAPSLLWEQVAFWSWMIHPWSVITRSFHQKDTLSPNWLGKPEKLTTFQPFVHWSHRRNQWGFSSLIKACVYSWEEETFVESSHDVFDTLPVLIVTGTRTMLLIINVKRNANSRLMCRN